MIENSAESKGLTRTSAFARSLIPSDLNKLFLLCGFLCLSIAPSLGWWPEELAKLKGLADGTPPEEYRRVYWHTMSFVGGVSLMTLPLRIAGAASLFAYFFPSKRLFRRFPYWTYLPVLISLLAVSVRLLLALWSPPSILESPLEYALGCLKNAPQTFLRLGPGFHFALAGMFFVALAAWRSRRHGSVPASTLDSSAKFIFHGPSEDLLELQTLRFTWIVIVTQWPVLIVAMSFTHIYTSIANVISFWPNWVLAVYQFLGEGLFSLTFVAIVVWAMAQRRYEVLKSCLRVPKWTNFALAVLLPVAAGSSFPFFQYVDDRIHWAAVGYGNYGPPLMESYFRFPGILSLWAVVPALAEEIAWRGYLQPRFIQLYGLARGILFTGIVWGAFHFTFDFGPLMSDQDAVLSLTKRLAVSVALSVPLAWITIRSGSVWPAAIVHGLYNILLGVGTPPPLAPWSTYGIWILLGLALFRFWPQANMMSSTPTLASTIEQGKEGVD